MSGSPMLKEKVAWVVGATSGIGLATARMLAAAGCTVVLSGRTEATLKDQVTELRKQGLSASSLTLDISDSNDVCRAAQTIMFDNGRIDILVNSAGTNVVNRLWASQDAAGWDSVLRVNLSGAYFCVAAVLPFMRRQGDGLIVNIGSWSGRHFTFAPGPAYNAAKAGIVAMTEHLNAEEYRHGIRACVVNPAETATPIMQRRPVPPSQAELAAMLQPDDVARVVLFVAEQPPHVCLNEITVSPTRNRVYEGALDSGRISARNAALNTPTV
jgi:NADP-dependent 3-hydroxy acid dehydrogenase YdfG